jgi:hypothetical protein
MLNKSRGVQGQALPLQLSPAARRSIQVASIRRADTLFEFFEARVRAQGVEDGLDAEEDEEAGALFGGAGEVREGALVLAEAEADDGGWTQAAQHSGCRTARVNL